MLFGLLFLYMHGESEVMLILLTAYVKVVVLLRWYILPTRRGRGGGREPHDEHRRRFSELGSEKGARDLWILEEMPSAPLSEGRLGSPQGHGW